MALSLAVGIVRLAAGPSWKPEHRPAADANVRTRSFDYHEPGVGVYFRFGCSEEDRNLWNVFVGVGLSARGGGESRPHDRMGSRP